MRKLSSVIIAIHCVLLLLSAWFGGSKKTQKQRLMVKTVTFKPKTAPLSSYESSIASASNPSSSKSSKPASSQKKNSSPQKKEVTKQIAKKPVKSSTKSASASITRELLQQLEESLAKIEQAPEVTRSPTKYSVSLPALKIDQFASEDGKYETKLVSFLRSQLTLPEVGEVEMKLTLQNNGVLVTMEVIRAESSKNTEYLKVRLPTLHLPHFMGALAKIQEETFVITFSNE